jgi:hypothetical protein
LSSSLLQKCNGGSAPLAIYTCDKYKKNFQIDSKHLEHYIINVNTNKPWTGYFCRFCVPLFTRCSFRIWSRNTENSPVFLTVSFVLIFSDQAFFFFYSDISDNFLYIVAKKLTELFRRFCQFFPA